MKRYARLALCLALATLLVGCGALGGDAAQGCAEPAAGMQLIRVSKHGYCLAYPAIYQVEQPHEAEMVFYQGALLDVEYARLQIKVEDAAGRTAQKAADALLKEFKGLDVARSELKLGGAPAVQLDGVPGQDLGRVVFVVKGKRLFKLTFITADSTEATRYAEMQALYAAVVGSWGFEAE